MPTFKTIRQTAAAGIMTEYYLRLLVAQGRCPGVYSGNRFLINQEALAAQLEAESQSGKRRPGKRPGKPAKKAASGTAIPETAAETGTALQCGHPSASHPITPAAAGQPLSIAGLLFPGPENGITLRELEALTGAKGRAIRRLIRQERLAGALILSDSRNGYFLAKNRREAEGFARSMIHRAGQIQRAAQAVMNASQTEGQEELRWQ